MIQKLGFDFIHRHMGNATTLGLVVSGDRDCVLDRAAIINTTKL